MTGTRWVAGRLAAAVACGLTGLSAVSPVVAQDTPVTAVLDPCVPVDDAQFARLLRIELGTSAPEPRDAAAPTHVRVACEGEGLVLDLQDGITRKSMRRALPVAPLQGEGGPRLLALAVAEFVVASWTELSLPEPPVEPIGPRPAPASRRAAAHKARVQQAPAPPSEPPAYSWGIDVGVSRFPGQTGGIIPGAGLQVRRRVGPVSFELGGEGQYWVEAVEPGQLRLTLGAARAGVFVGTRGAHSELELGLGARIGFLRASGQPTTASRFRGYTETVGTSAAWLSLGAYYVAGPDLRLGVLGRGGIMTWPMRARLDERDTVLELSGFWFGVALAADFGFGA